MCPMNSTLSFDASVWPWQLPSGPRPGDNRLKTGNLEPATVWQATIYWSVTTVATPLPAKVSSAPPRQNRPNLCRLRNCPALRFRSRPFRFRKKSPPVSVQPAANSANSAATHSAVHPALTIDQMKQMADVQASALIEKSKAEPQNAFLLSQIALIYQGAHQFDKATDYLYKSFEHSSQRRERAHAVGVLSVLFWGGR